MFTDYLKECMERNTNISVEIPFFTIIEEKVIKNKYTIGIIREDIIVKIQRLWRNWKKIYNRIFE